MPTYRRQRWAGQMIIAGSALLVLGIFLLLVKLVMYLAWYAAGTVALVGLIMFLTGLMLRG